MGVAAADGDAVPQGAWKIFAQKACKTLPAASDSEAKKAGLYSADGALAAREIAGAGYQNL